MGLKITINNLIRLHSGLDKIGNLKGRKFAYAVSKNVDIVDQELKHYSIERNEISGKYEQKKSKDYKKYDKERGELCLKHCKKDEKKRPVIENNKFIMVDDDKFNKDLKKLQKKHEAFKEHESAEKEFQNMLDDEMETKIELFMINIELVPEDISVSQMKMIKEIITEKAVEEE